jgi:hypothetical protein
MNHIEKLQTFAAELRSEMLVEHTFKSGKRKNTTVVIPHRFPPSLQSLGEMYCGTDYERFKVRKVE